MTTNEQIDDWITRAERNSYTLRDVEENPAAAHMLIDEATSLLEGAKDPLRSFDEETKALTDRMVAEIAEVGERYGAEMAAVIEKYDLPPHVSGLLVSYHSKKAQAAMEDLI